MSQPPPQWQWDKQSRRWYMVDRQRGCYAFEDGTTVPFAPRSHPSSASQRPASAKDLSTSPTMRNATYGLSTGAISSSSRQDSSSFVQPSQGARQPPPSSPDPLVQDFAPMTLQDRPSARLRNEERDYTDQQGRHFLDVRDPVNLVRTTLQIGPPNGIPTDPELVRQGIRATQMLMGTAATTGDTEQLFEGFRRRQQPRNFFTFGKVFRVLWSEPAGDTRTLVTFEAPGISTGRFGERVHSKVRLFVVIREADTYCSALSIASYSYQGVAKLGVKKSEHGIIHSGRVPPAPTPEEAPKRGEEPMRSDAIRVNPDDLADPLHVMSRLDYGKVYTIQHNIKVKSYGVVHPSSLAALRHQFINVWLGENHARAVETPPSNPAAGGPAATGSSNAHTQRRRRDSHSTGTATVSDARATAGTGSSSNARESQARQPQSRTTRTGRVDDEDRGTSRATSRRAVATSQRSEESDSAESAGDDSDREGGNAGAGANARNRSTSRIRGQIAVQTGQAATRGQHPPRVDSRAYEQVSAQGSSGGRVYDTTPAAVRNPATQSLAPLHAQAGHAGPSSGQQPTHAGASTSQPGAPPHAQKPQTLLNAQLQAAVRRLMEQGYTREQALQHAAAALARQRGQRQ